MTWWPVTCKTPENSSINTAWKESRRLDLEHVPRDMSNINYPRSWDVGGRKFVLNVFLNWHAKIQGQISNHQFSHSYSKKKVSPKRVTFLVPEECEEKLKQSCGKATLWIRFTNLTACSGWALKFLHPWHTVIKGQISLLPWFLTIHGIQVLILL